MMEDRQERWANSKKAEHLAHELYGGECQVAFVDGKRLKHKTTGCVIIDIFRTLPNGTQEAIEVKWFDGFSFRDGGELLFQLRRQLNKQKEHLPKKVKQRVFVLVRGFEMEAIKEERELLEEGLGKKIDVAVIGEEMLEQMIEQFVMKGWD